LIMMGNKKQGVGSEDKVGLFWMHDVSRFSVMVPIKTRCSCFPSFLALGWWQKLWHVLHVEHVFLDKH
jgi:hypothetical protein